MDNGLSIYHTILKLTDESYRNSSIYDRKEMAENLKKELNLSEDLTAISEKINLGIKVFSGQLVIIIGKKMENWILINECKNFTYEPIVYKEGSEINYMFSKDSFLI